MTEALLAARRNDFGGQMPIGLNMQEDLVAIDYFDGQGNPSESLIFQDSKLSTLVHSDPIARVIDRLDGRTVGDRLIESLNSDEKIASDSLVDEGHVSAGEIASRVGKPLETAAGTEIFQPVETGKSLSMRQKVLGSAIGKKLTALAATTVSIFGAQAAAPSINTERQGIVGSAIEAVSVDEAEGAFEWRRLGGDPLQPNVNTREEFRDLMFSDKGTKAMQLLGLNKQERKAIREQLRRDRFTKCKVEFGEQFDAMSFGDPQQIRKDVTFLDDRFKENGADAWCVEAKVNLGGGRTKTIKLETPFICGNVSLKEEIIRRGQKKANVQAGKVFEDAYGKQLPFLPGVARVEWKCGKNGEFKPVIVMRPTQRLGKCAVGKSVTVRERDTIGADGRAQPLAIGDAIPTGAHWRIVTPRSVSVRKLSQRGLTARFKNQQLPPVIPRVPEVPIAPPPPPPPVTEQPNNAPTGIMDLHERIEFTTGKVCVTDIKDLDGDNANVLDFRFTGPTGTSIGVERGSIYTLPPEISTTKTQCQDYEAPSVFASQGRVTVEADISDGKPNGKTILRNNMPITPEER